MGGQKATLSAPVQAYAEEVATDEINHVSSFERTNNEEDICSAIPPPLDALRWQDEHGPDLDIYASLFTYMSSYATAAGRWLSCGRLWALPPSPAP